MTVGVTTSVRNSKTRDSTGTAKIIKGELFCGSPLFLYIQVSSFCKAYFFAALSVSVNPSDDSFMKMILSV